MCYVQLKAIIDNVQECMTVSDFFLRTKSQLQINMLPMKHSFVYRRFLTLEQVFSFERQLIFELLMKRLIT